MFYPLKLYFRDRVVIVSCAFAVAAQFFVWWHILANIKRGPEQVFLHYNTIFGVDLAGEWWKLLFMPAVGLAILVLNSLGALLIYSRDSSLAKLLNIMTAVLHIFLLIAVVLVVRLNI